MNGDEVLMVMQGLSVDVHGLADGLKGLVEAGLAKAAGQYKSTQFQEVPASFAPGTLHLAMITHCAAKPPSRLHLTSHYFICQGAACTGSKLKPDTCTAACLVRVQRGHSSGTDIESVAGDTDSLAGLR